MGTSLMGQLIGMIIVTILCPFVGTFIITGCGIDGLITLLLCIFGLYLAGLIHALILVVIWYQRCVLREQGILLEKRAPGIVSERIHQGIPLGRTNAMRAREGEVVNVIVEPNVIVTEKSKKKPAASLDTGITSITSTVDIV